MSAFLRPAPTPEQQLLFDGSCAFSSIPPEDPSEECLDLLERINSLQKEQVLGGHIRLVFVIFHSLPTADEGPLNGNTASHRNFSAWVAVNPLHRLSSKIVADKIYEHYPLAEGDIFYGSTGLTFVLPAGWTCLPSPIGDLLALVNGKVVAFDRAKVQTPGITAPISSTSLPTAPLPSNSRMASGYTIEDLDKRLFPCADNKLAPARMLEIQACVRLMSMERTLVFIVDLKIDPTFFLSRLKNFARIAACESYPADGEYKVTSLLWNVLDFSIFQRSESLLAALHGKFDPYNYELLSWDLFIPSGFAPWKKESTRAGRLQLRRCIEGLQKFLAVVFSGVFKSSFLPLLIDLEDHDHLFVGYHDIYVACILWRVLANVLQEVKLNVKSTTDSLPLTTPVMINAVFHKVIETSLADLRTSKGDWIDRSPHDLFYNQDCGFLREIDNFHSGAAKAKAVSAPIIAPEKGKPSTGKLGGISSEDMCAFHCGSIVGAKDSQGNLIQCSRTRCPAMHPDALSLTKADMIKELARLPSQLPNLAVICDAVRKARNNLFKSDTSVNPKRKRNQ